MAFAGLYTGSLTYFNGPAAPGVPVTVTPHGSPTLATLWTDRYKTNLAPNPVMPDAAGNFFFYAVPGLYDYTAAGYTFPTVEIYTDPADVGIIASALLITSNLSDLSSVPTALGNLGIGSAGLQPSSAFDAAGTATAVTAAETTRALAAEATERARALAAEAALAGGGPAGSYPNASGPATVSPRPVWLDIRDYGAALNGTTDDTTANQNALNAIPASGGVVCIPGTTLISATLIPKSNTRILGFGKVSQFLCNTAIPKMFAAGATTPALSDLTFENLGFVGKNIDPGAVAYPRNGRSQSGPGADAAIRIEGSLVPGSAFPPVANISVLGCWFRHFKSLPVLIAGASGDTEVLRVNAYNSLDIGFTFLDSLIFNDNIVERCSDDGVSISRGCKKVVCNGNRMRDIANSGIWMSGWNVNAAPGPDNFSMVGNEIYNCGQSGIFLTSGPRYGTVVGNVIDGVHRGAVDNPNDLYGNGIEISGYIYTYSGSAGIAQAATAIDIVGNTVRNADNNAIYVLAAANNIHIVGNKLIDFGSQFKADGTTAILASDITNSGIMTDAGGQSPTTYLTDISMIANSMIDTRGTPFANFDVRYSGGAGTRFTRFGNVRNGMRNPTTENVLSYSRSGSGETAAEAALRAALAASGFITDLTTA